MIRQTLQEHEVATVNAKELYDSLYYTMFQTYFEPIQDFYSAMKSRHKVSDGELEAILIEVPLDMFKASESLNDLRLKYETTRLAVNKKLLEEKRRSREDLRDSIEQMSEHSEFYNKTELKEIAAESVQLSMIDDDVLLNVYKSLITRVENELSFARELIMGAKKVWDSRRSAEKSNPVSETDLPPYTMNRKDM